MVPSPTEVEYEQQPRRTSLPKVPGRAEDSRHKFSKSRNGCVTCKSRRVKCDETKPACNQCARRRIECGGYRMDVRFKTAREPKKNSAIVKSPRQYTFPASRPRTASGGSRKSQIGDIAAIPIIDPGGADEFQLQTASGPSHSEGMMDLTFLDPEMLTSRSLPTPQSLELLEVGLHTSPPFLQPDNVLNPDFPLQDLGQLSAEVNAQSYTHDYGPPFWNINYFLEDYVNSLSTTPIMPAELGLSLGESVEDDAVNPQVSANEREKIDMLFLKTTCHNLSIEEDSEKNPWKTVIWPMARQYPALYHALAALTCFHTSKAQPQLRTDGQRHLHTSAHLLSEGINKSEIPLDAALAATLALGFAETWDSESATTGMTHITGAGILLQQMLENRISGAYTQQEEARLEFLYNTWTYMDVIARFTCLDLCPPVPESLVAATVGRLDFSTSKLDPLMGYCTSFFPIMRRVADLLCKVRVRNAYRNSPAIISQALELKRIIEDWAPPVDLETVEDHSQLMTDAIQTAEAYRWSTLSLLYQTVPELPNQTSYGELAQKILVYLATIPLSSPTIIVHILPLIIAGNDSVEAEDRDFVRDRWKAMSKRLVTGIVERALEITEEVWKRRDDYWHARGLSRAPEDLVQGEAISPTHNAAYGTASGDGSPSSGGCPAVGPARMPVRKVNSFPISAAFKKGVDTITRSGSIDYTVRGNLHWLGVMKDWQWQVLLG
ncbi:fungal-specific transcription factor domain-containing protein [Boeremia exigua]|uniref:fungal-specific transcription factor domain-containing protein n=1 Tax=Boeremia exigua TaxID=749465 RepID=UPI001E8D7BE6|nr:fungal-specific transcription factor domain-containing protein [Boeremia exigua]KAH6644091.1 fungal-specific transcription factor domain-containing protein [Boeremia exigua]